jgi:hypothetical protein
LVTPTRRTPPRVAKVGLIDYNERNGVSEIETNNDNVSDEDKSDSLETESKGSTVLVEAFSVSDHELITTLNNVTESTSREVGGGTTTSPGFIAYKKIKGRKKHYCKCNTNN